MSERLEDLRERLARVLRGPDAIEAQLLFRLARPILSLTGWRAALQSSALIGLLAGLRAARADVLVRLEAAFEELGRNVEALERVTLVRKRVPVAHALWLRRVCDVLELGERLVLSELTPEPTLLRQLADADPSALFPPLALHHDKRRSEGELPIEDHPAVDDVRLVDLELAAIDHLIAAARMETMLLGRKRRLLFAARQRLLEASAALPIAREGARSRQVYLAQEIGRLDRLQAWGLDPDVSLVHQARQALTRRDGRRLHAALSALDHGALAAADGALASRTGPVLAQIDSHGDPRNRRRVAKALLGDTPDLITDVVKQARQHAMQTTRSGAPRDERDQAKEFLRYLPADAGDALISATMLADGYFEVGGALVPTRVVEEQRVVRQVRHPTPDLLLARAEDVHDLREALLVDPRSVLLDLATGRLFTRRFVREEVELRRRTVLRAEVRVYVLDGSGSMEGARARVRDSILIAELSTLMARLRSPGETRCTLFYRYFDSELGPVTRVDSVQAARDAITSVVSTQRAGGTDIQLALLASLEQIALARAADPELARAQIVLVTDGEAAVDEGAVVAARAALGDLPVGISVIALGEENHALRQLVARQRAKGEPVFYHFLDDGQLTEIANGEGLHEGAPERWLQLEADPAALARALDAETAGLLDELELLERTRDAHTLEQLELERQARRELGVAEQHDGPDGLLARAEALHRDRLALGVRYARFFPEPIAASAHTQALPAVGSETRDDLDAVCCALTSVAEVVDLLGGTPLARQADAIELLERLLPDAALTPATYRAVLRQFPHAVAAPLAALHAAVRGASSAGG